MRAYLVLAGSILSFSLYGNALKPCEAVGYEKVAEYAIPSEDGTGTAYITIPGRNRAIKLLKECLHHFAVCIVEADLHSSDWLSEELIEPADGNFDSSDRRLVFGLVQYVDKKSGSSICIVAGNSFARAVPWIGESWVIDNKNIITEYELYGDRFNTSMTPSSLYKALLESHKDEVASAKRHAIQHDIRDDIEMKEKIEAAQQMLEEGSDPSFVSKLTGISLEGLKLLNND
jgi:hypothetical protein